MPEQSKEVSKLIAQGISLRNLPNSKWREWTQVSRRHPEDRRLRQFLLEGLWGIQQFREVLELLPPLEDENLELGLKWRTQTLFRLAFKGTSFVKRLIPDVISYSSYLGDIEANAILQLLNDLVQSREDKALCQYHKLVLSVSKGVRQSLQDLQIPFNPRLLLSPEVAARLAPATREEIFEILKKSASPFVSYYASGGHFLLLAEGGFFSGITIQERKMISEEVNFQLDVVTAFKSPRKISQSLRPHQKYITSTTSAQVFLASQLHHFFVDLRMVESQLQDREALKAITEVYEYLTELFEFASKQKDVLVPVLDMVYLQSHVLYFERAKVKLSASELESLLTIVDKLSKDPASLQILPELANSKRKIEELFTKLCLQKLDLKGLFKLLASNSNNDLMGVCLDYIDQIIGDCSKANPNIMYLDKVEFCLQVLANFKSQKPRQKILKEILKVLRKKKGIKQ